jgi:hypothetical protein
LIPLHLSPIRQLHSNNNAVITTKRRRYQRVSHPRGIIIPCRWIVRQGKIMDGSKNGGQYWIYGRDDIHSRSYAAYI